MPHGYIQTQITAFYYPFEIGSKVENDAMPVVWDEKKLIHTMNSSYQHRMHLVSCTNGNVEASSTAAQ